MHLNAHLAFSTVVTLLLASILPVQLSFLEVAVCIAAGFAVDADFVLVRFAKYRNHRYLLTHSMFLPFILVVLSVCLLFLIQGTSLAWTSWICAVNVLIHDIVDSIDWGLNFFANGKIVGMRILLGGKTPEEFYAEARREAPIFAAFYKVYYGSATMRTLEAIAAAAMCIALVISWPGMGHDHWWTILAYLGFLCFHIVEYYRGLHPKHSSIARTGARR
ncbi:MAG: hypothetical protein Q6373_005970 [Candidatus Sigynarchaeota archaeon]